MTKSRFLNISACLSVLFFSVVGTAQSVAQPPSAVEVRIDSERYGRIIERIEIKKGDLMLQVLRPDQERWQEDSDEFVQIRLPYEYMASLGRGKEPLDAWDPIFEGGPPTLIVEEYIVGGSAPGSPRCLMRIFIWENDQFRELPPAEGRGELYYFEDLNDDGTMEFVNQEGLAYHDLSDAGLPLSQNVYFFNGEQYEPVTEEDTWPEVLSRMNEARRSKATVD